MMKSEKRSLSIDEVKELPKTKNVKKICGGRIWVTVADKPEVKL